MGTQAIVDSLGILDPEIVERTIADGATKTHGTLFKPANFDPTKTDPLLLSVYGDPTRESSLGLKQSVERGMRSPEENVEGYENSTVLNYVTQLEGKLLLYFGRGDQNTVGVNAEQLVDALVQAGKPFDMMSYPEGQHVMQGKRYHHVMTKQLAYFLEHLKPMNWQASIETIWNDLDNPK